MGRNLKISRAILVLAALLFICNIWGYDLWAPDEPFFGEGAREMVVDGQWVVTHVNGKVNTHKPPLFFWLISLFSLPFGTVLSFTARLPSVLAALGTVVLTLRMGRRMSSEKTAVLAAFALATSYLFWDKARSVQIDALLCLLIWVALSAFETWRTGDLDGRRAGLIFWCAAALAVLAKGPVGLLLPLGVALVTLAFDREIGRWRSFAPFTGPLLFTVVCGAWGIHGMHHAQPWWYYAKVLPPQLIPWTFLVPGALLLAWRRRDRDDRFLLVASLFVVLFFSISTEKRTLYVLPAFPAFALMTARLVGSVLKWDAAPTISRRWITAGQAILGNLLTILGLAAPLAAARVEVVPAWMFWFLAAILVATGVATLYQVFRKRILQAACAPAVGVVVAFLFVAIFVLPQFDALKSGRAFAQKIKEATASSRSAGHRVLAVDLGNLPIHWAFYSDGVYTVETSDPEDLLHHLDQEAQVFAAVNRPYLDDLPSEIRERMVEIASTRASRKDAVLIANRDAPIANRR
jgi:4-amino-4-deoxy-L-arabinose transferase-like glycosyltransferase